CLKRYRDQLRAHTQPWGMAGYALASVDDFRAAARWLSDYAGRSDAAPWMLVNLVIALRATGDEAGANRVSRWALERPADHTSRYHRIWLAVDEALAGGPGAAVRLEGIEPKSCDATHRFVYALVPGVLAVAQAEPAVRRQAFVEVRRRWRAAAAECAPLV